VQRAAIVLNGPEWFAGLGPEKNGGPKLYCISGHVKRPGVYEASMHTTLRELIYGEPFAQGMAGGKKFKAIIPGGSSVPLLLDEHLDTPASFDGVQKAGSLLGSAGLIVLDETVCMVWLAMNLLHFYRHESCGKCTPCREGGNWLYQLLQRVEAGEGRMKDIDLLFGVANNIVGQDAVRVRRRGGDARADDAEAVPPRVRGARERRAAARCRPSGAPSIGDGRTLDAQHDLALIAYSSSSLSCPSTCVGLLV
jgi:NADH:ubiquinone oxidoreductase subunit F (NADH-binding)